jgi:hypothetical protein
MSGGITTESTVQIVEELRGGVRALALRGDVVALGEAVEPVGAGGEREDRVVVGLLGVLELADEPVALEHHGRPAGEEQVERLRLVDAHERLEHVLGRPDMELLEGLPGAGLLLPAGLHVQSFRGRQMGELQQEQRARMFILYKNLYAA